MSMAGRMFQGVGQVAIGNPPAVLNVAHGLAAIPTVFFAIPRTFSPAAAALNTYVVTADITNVIITAAGNWAAAVDFDVFAWVVSEIADEITALANTAHRNDIAGTSHTTLVTNATNGAAVAAALTKSATENCILRSFPTGYAASREGTLNTGSIAASGTYLRTLAQLQTAFPGIDFNLPVEFESDNPLVTIIYTVGTTIAGGLTFTNLDSVNAQFATIKVKQIHSFNR